MIAYFLQIQRGLKFSVSLFLLSPCYDGDCCRSMNQSFLSSLFLFSTQVGSQPITCISWIPTLRVLVTVSKDGSLQVWKTHPPTNPNWQSTQSNFFEPAG